MTWLELLKLLTAFECKFFHKCSLNLSLLTYFVFKLVFKHFKAMVFLKHLLYFLNYRFQHKLPLKILRDFSKQSQSQMLKPLAPSYLKEYSLKQHGINSKWHLLNSYFTVLNCLSYHYFLEVSQLDLNSKSLCFTCCQYEFEDFSFQVCLKCFQVLLRECRVFDVQRAYLLFITFERWTLKSLIQCFGHF